MDKILKNKITILILGAMMVLTLGSQSVFAQSQPVLVVSPVSLTKNVGDSFDLTVKVQPNGQKVCAVEGQLLLSKFTVQKINVASGIISQTPPSYSNGLYFLLGIPKCTTQETNLFTVRVKAISIGQATASFKKVDIIGEGKSISKISQNGSYKIILKFTPKKKKNKTIKVIKIQDKKTTVKNQEKQGKVLSASVMCNCKKWNNWQNKGCGQGECLDTQMEQIRTRVCQPTGCDVEKQYQCVNDHNCIANAKTPKNNQSKVIQPKNNSKNNSFLSIIGNILTLGTNKIGVGILTGIIILVLIISTVWWIKKK